MINFIKGILGQCVLFVITTPLILLSRFFNGEEDVKDKITSVYQNLIQETIDKTEISVENCQIFYEELLATLFLTTLSLLAFRSIRQNILHDMSRMIKRKITWKMSMNGERVILETPGWFNY